MSYTAAQLAARALAGDLGADALQQLATALREYAADLTAELAALPSGSAPALDKSLGLSRRIVFGQISDLQTVIDQVVTEGRSASYTQVEKIWTTALDAVAKAEGVPDNLLGSVQSGRMSLANAYNTARPYTYRSLINGHINNAQEEVNRIIHSALVQGTSPDELARRLRPYVQGSEYFHQSFGGTMDWRSLQSSSQAGQQAARQLQYNAARIAFTEIHNARNEAALSSFASDPLVAAARWTLARNRGSLRLPDECDAFAHTDYYGLGPGVFPLDKVPVPPHPWCRCDLFPVKRNVSAMGDAKPSPSRVPGTTPDVGGRAGEMTKVQLQRLDQEAARQLTQVEQEQVREGILRIQALRQQLHRQSP